MKLRPPKNAFAWFYGFLILACIALYVYTAMNRGYDDDEFEHIHTAWYMLNGYVPYKDFFQHHNPLLWILLMPAIAILGERVRTIIACRLLMVVILTIQAYFAGKTAALLADDDQKTQYQYLTMAILLSGRIVMQRGMEIRSDNLMVTLVVMSFYFLFAFLQKESHQSRSLLYIASVLLGLSFLALQKMAVFVPVFGSFFLYLLWKKRITPQTLLVSSGFALLPIVGFVIYLAANQCVDVYWYTNVVLNANQYGVVDSVSLWDTNGSPEIMEILTTCVVAVFCVGFFVFRKKRDPILTACAANVLLNTAFGIVANCSYPQYFLPVFPFAAILIVVFCQKHLLPPGIGQTVSAVSLCMLLLLVNIATMSFKTVATRPNRDLRRVDFVLSNTTKDDYVYDGMSNVNLFRKDVDYFWYALDFAVPIHNKLSGGSFDVEASILRHQPKFISDYMLDTSSELFQQYEQTEYRHLYVRTAD